jgi:replicative DNA helicase
MDINILNLINAERNTDIELLEDMDNKISAVDYFNCLSDSLDEFDERAWNKREGYKTPNFPSLTDGLEGWDSGLYIFAGLANHGKTMIMTNIMEDLVMNPDNKLFGVFYSLDDNKNKVIPRIIAMRERLPISLIAKPGRYQKMVDEGHPDAINIAQQLDRRTEGIANLRANSNKMMILDSQEIKTDKDLYNSIHQIYNYVKAMDEEANIVVAVDGLKDINFVDMKLTENEKVDIASRFLKDISVELDIIVMSTMHLRKLNGNRRPTTEDLKDSNRLEYEADVIYLVYNEVSRNKDAAKVFSRTSETGPKQPILELDWAKNKISSYKGRTFCYFAPEYSKAVECEEEDAKRFNALVYSL